MFISSIKPTTQNTFQEVEQISFRKVLKITALATLTMWTIDPFAISYRMRECLLLTFTIGAIDQLMESKKAKECHSHSCPSTNISDTHPIEAASEIYLRAFIPQTRKNEIQEANTEQIFQQLSFFQTPKEKTGTTTKIIALATILIAINSFCSSNNFIRYLSRIPL